MDEHQIKAFWSKVDVQDDDKECWPWLGACTPKGYGNLGINGKTLKAHRVAWELCNFEIPDGYVVMHTCDNPVCCNPNHLALATHKTNTTDMILKNRGGFHKNRAIGERNYNAKLTADDVRAIRREYAHGKVNQYDLADKYGVTQVNISCILKNKTWRHVA